MSLSSIVQDIADNIVDGFNWAASEVVQHSSAVCEFAGRQYTTVVEPGVQSLIARIQNIDVVDTLSDIKGVLQSDFGISAILLGGSAACVIASRKVDNKVASIFLVLAGIMAATCSAVMLFKPELFRFPAPAPVPAPI